MVNSAHHDKPTDDRYIAALEGLHHALMLAMGEALYAPIDLNRPGLSILDSGCNNGRWLFDIAELCPSARHNYVGTDLLGVFFPPHPPQGFEFVEQDICNPWPEAWYDSFDVVHQRTVLVNARKNPIQDVVSELVKVLKLGGWIQLMEGDFRTIEGSGPALREFLELGAWFFDIAGPGRDMGPELKATLRGIGLDKAQDKIVYVAVGAKLKDESRAVIDGSIEGLCAAIPGSLDIIKGMDHPFSFKRLESLEDRLRQELLELGGQLCYRVAWAMRPP